jgi:hypothetical protein
VLTYFVLVLIETGPSEYVPIRCFFREMDIDYRGRSRGVEAPGAQNIVTMILNWNVK